MNLIFSIDIYIWIYKGKHLLNKLKLLSLIWSARVAHTGRLHPHEERGCRLFGLQKGPCRHGTF